MTTGSPGSSSRPAPARRPVLGLIWAQTPGRVIGRDGALPWHLPEDMAHFRAVTDGHPVVMGRATWQSLPERFRPLPGRPNLVLSRDPAFVAPGARVASSLEAALARAAGAPRAADGPAADDDRGTPRGRTGGAHTAAPDGDEVWVVGGAAVYAAALPLADRIEVTEVDVDAAGDARAPAVDPTAWTVTTGPWLTSRTGLRYRFATYTRADPDVREK